MSVQNTRYDMTLAGFDLALFVCGCIFKFSLYKTTTFLFTMSSPLHEGRVRQQTWSHECTLQLAYVPVVRGDNERRPLREGRGRVKDRSDSGERRTNGHTQTPTKEKNPSGALYWRVSPCLVDHPVTTAHAQLPCSFLFLLHQHL